MKKLLFAIILAILVTGAWFVYTNPSEDMLRQDAEYYITAEIEKSLPKSATEDGFTSDLIHLRINESVDIADFYFFKKVSYTWEGRTSTIGYGYLNTFHPGRGVVSR